MNYKLYKESIDAFSSSIADEVATIRFYEVDRVKAIIATRLLLAMQDLLLISLQKLEEEKADLLKLLHSPVISNIEKQRIKGRLSEIKLELKLNGRLENINNYQQLKKYLKDQNMQHVLDSFYKTFVNINPQHNA